MPIKAINEDGTVTIVRKSGKDPMTVKPEELAKYNPALLEDYNNYTKAQAELKGEPDKKESTTFNKIDNLVNTLESRYMGAGGGEFTGTGARISGVKKNVSGALGLDDQASAYKDAREGFAATLKTLTGDVGVLTQPDYERLVKLVPSLGATPGEAKIKFEDLRSQVAASFGGEKSDVTYQAPESKGGAMAALLPGVNELYQQKKQAVEEQGIGAVPKQSIETMFPALNIYNPATAIKEKSVTAGYNPAGGKAASEILTILGLAQGVGAAKNKLTGGGPIGSAGRARTLAGATAESEGVELANKEILDNTIKKISSSKKLGLKDKEKAIQFARDNFADEGITSVQESIGQFMDADAWTKGGTKIKGPKGLYNGALRDTYKELWQAKAPEVLKQTQVMAKLYKTKKGLMNALRLTGATAGAVGGGMYLKNLLTGQTSGQ